MNTDDGPRALVSSLRALGLRSGARLLVHSSLRSLTSLGCDPEVLYRALRKVIGPEGTVVVPTFTPDNSLSSSVHLRRVRALTPEERSGFLQSMPAFDPLTTPSTGMGRFAEYVRTSEESVRSTHPQTSFAALGPDAKLLMADHDQACHLGERSPLAELYSHSAHILMIGVGYESCSAFHLAEYRYRHDPPLRRYDCVIKEYGDRRWWSYVDVVLDDSDFPGLGYDMESQTDVSLGTFCGVDMRLIDIRTAVDFATQWLRANRN